MKKHNITACLAAVCVMVAAQTPGAQAAPQNDQNINPVGYNIVDGRQDTDNPITDTDLILDVGYSATQPNFGTEYTTEDVIGTDDRDEVTDSTEAPYRWTGTLEFNFPSGKRVACTASLISPDAALTAGHCLDESFTDFSFSPGQNGDNRPYGTAKVVQVWRDQNWHSNLDIENDWGVVKLDRPIGEKTGWFGVRSTDGQRLSGQTVTVIGYPTDKPANTMWVGSGRVTFESRGRAYHNTDTQPGNSGSPVLDSRSTIMAIHFGGDKFTAVSTRMTNNMFNAVISIAFTDRKYLGVYE